MRTRYPGLLAVAVALAACDADRSTRAVPPISPPPLASLQPAPPPGGGPGTTIQHYFVPGVAAVAPAFAPMVDGSPAPAGLEGAGTEAGSANVAGSASVVNPNVFWFQLRSSPTATFWIALDTTFIRADGVRTGSFVESTLIDTTGQATFVPVVWICAPRYLNPECQLANDSAVVLECPRVGSFNTHCPSGTMPWDSTYYMTGISTSKVPVVGQQWYSVTSWVQAVGVNPANALTGSPKSIVYRYYNTILVSPGTIDVLVTQSDFNPIADQAGSIQYKPCSGPYSCGLGNYNLIPPTNVVLAVAGPYPRVTWSNNGDTTDSSEVWFGKSGQEVKVGVFPNSITSYFGQWSGGGIYHAYVYHRKGALISTLASSNSLTH